MTFQLICTEWPQPNNVLFQLANIFIVLSNVELNNAYNLLYLRFCLLLSSTCFWLWGWLVLCSFDTFLWNFIFTCINLFHVTVLLYNFYPFFVKLDKDAEKIYLNFFKSKGVSRNLFNNIIFKNIYEIQNLEKGDIYCVQNLTHINKLSLLFSGRIAVIRDEIVINELTDLTFIDSAEWFITSKKGETPLYRVTILALEKSTLFIWDIYLMRKLLAKEPSLEAVVNRIIGEDAIKRVYFQY